MGDVVCPRCGFKNSFNKGFLPDTCVCRVCQSQLDWREIPGMGPDCRPLDESSDEQKERPRAAQDSAHEVSAPHESEGQGS